MWVFLCGCFKNEGDEWCSCPEIIVRKKECACDVEGRQVEDNKQRREDRLLFRWLEEDIRDEPVERGIWGEESRAGLDVRVEDRDVEETSSVDHVRVEVAVCENRRLLRRFIQRVHILQKGNADEQECLEAPGDREESFPAVVAHVADIPEPQLDRAVYIGD